jgi:hypothetical protein
MKLLIALASFFALMGHAEAKVNLKIGTEIYAAYVNITGISGDKELRDLYKLNINRLPKSGETDEMTNGVVLATTELGGAFCKKALIRDMALPQGGRILFGLVNFKRGPSQFSDFLREEFIDQMGVQFWQRDVTAAEKAMMSKIMTDVIKNSPDSTDETATLMQVMCTTYATSLAFLVK